ncbi:type II toxin-antitoxin system RelE/ParE family toxin [Reichenbachiella sp. MSK19-1]|uniref:type II toxin-antitoxin system RelE/ParE family toxin n=1 Tax=Reichenbachiella sp. MSK19-1 TaxID=1897631 RepID=UPI000E6BDCC5
MGKVVWTKTSLDQFERIVKYISEERGNSYAKIVGARIIERTEQLEDFPELGSKEPLLQHKKSEYRFLVAWSYKIIYRLSKDKITISRIFHTAQNPNKLKGI